MNVIDRNSTSYSFLVFLALFYEHSLKQYRRAQDHLSPLLQTFPAKTMTLKLDVLAHEGEIFQGQFENSLFLGQFGLPRFFCPFSHRITLQTGTYIQRIGAANCNHFIFNLQQIPADFNKHSLMGFTLLITKS